MKFEILYRDSDLVAVNKPENIAAVPERANDPECLSALVSQSLGTKAWPVHRLDKEVSGVILFALHADAHRFLNTAFENRHVQKTYLAVVHGVPIENEGLIDRPIREFGSGRMGVDPRGKPSVTAFRVLKRGADFSLLEVSPRTGRRHQIRVHLYSLGHPIVGDLRYGDPAKQKSFPRLMLHASTITLTLPSGKPLSLHDVPSATFAGALSALQLAL